MSHRNCKKTNLSTFFVSNILLVISIMLFLKTGTAQDVGHSFVLPLDNMTATMAKAPDRSDEDVIKPVISLPNHLGNQIRYEVTASSVMSKEMEEKFPDFKTYSIKGVDHSLAYGRLFVSRFGIEGLIVSGSNTIKIEPKNRNNPVEHIAYLYEKTEDFICQTHEEAKAIKGSFSGVRNPNGGTIRQYEMAIACTGEFYQNSDFGNNNMTQANAAVVNIINLINIYWNAEMSILISIFQNPVIYTNPSSDPFNPSGTNLTTQASTTIHSNFPSGGYDLGHALHAYSGGGAGVAGVGVVCNNIVSGGGRVNSRGWSGGSTQNLLAIGIMTHEVGHMFNSPHTFNGSEGNCLNQIGGSTAYEIGSGSTLMSYAGLCGSQNVQSSQDLYFHSKSLELFYTYISSVSCQTNSSSGNTPPTADATICAGPYTIPIMTPFELTGSGSDPNGNSLTYVWEQIDEDGPGTAPTQGFIGSTAANSNLAPLFRSFPPSPTGWRRTFPSQSLLLANSYESNFEPLPNVSRTLNFRLTVRDNVTPHGAYHYDNIAVTVDGTKGPLTVTSPNTNISVNSGSNLSCTWDVNNTHSICNSVNILLSVDGGLTYPYTLASASANDGIQSVLMPSNIPTTTSARIRIESNCISCVKFFDISNTNFTINSACNVVVNNICNVSPLTAPEGSNNLNMNLSPAFGNSFTTQAMNPSGSGVVSAHLDGPSPGTGGCTGTNWNDRAATVRFKPTQSGDYIFNIQGGYRHLTIYTDQYIPTQHCTNFLTSTIYGLGQVSNPITVSLDECETYVAVFFDQVVNNGTLTITPPSGAAVYMDNPPTNNNYSYTYLAVNASNNIITAVSATSNFTTLPGGNYCIYGVYYYSGTSNPPGQVNPSSFIGQTLTAFQNSGSCIQISQNCKPVEVTSTCSTVVTSSADSGAGSLRSAITCNSPGTTITFHSSITQVNLTSSLTINKNIRLQGTSPTTRPEIVLSSSGLNVTTGNVLSLHNMDLRFSGSQMFQGNGQVVITGYTRTRQ